MNMPKFRMLRKGGVHCSQCQGNVQSVPGKVQARCEEMSKVEQHPASHKHKSENTKMFDKRFAFQR